MKTTTTKRTPRKTRQKRVARTAGIKKTRRKPAKKKTKPAASERITAAGTKAAPIAEASRKSQVLPPYNDKGRSNFRAYAGKSGVYIIRENGKVVYIGFSGKDLYKTMHRHFETWNAKQYVVTYKGNRKKYTVQIFLTAPAKAMVLEQALIAKYKPRDNDLTPSLDLYKKAPKTVPVYNNTTAPDIYEGIPF